MEVREGGRGRGGEAKKEVGRREKHSIVASSFLFFTYFCPHWVLVAAKGLLVASRGLCPAAVSGVCSPAVVCRRLVVVVSLVVDTGSRAPAAVVTERRLWLPCGVWTLPGPGMEPVSPALAGRL